MMKYEKSCGAVVVDRFGGEYRVLLIRHVNGGHWSFPKGHVENGENETETALREIKEETGLDVSLDTGFRHVTVYCPEKAVTKDVVYFLAKAGTERVSAQKEEVRDAGWFTPEEAGRTVTYENDRRILGAAAVYMKDRYGA